MHTIILSGGHYPLVRDMGYTNVGEGWHHPDRVLDYNVFIYCYEGYLPVVEDGAEYVMKPGDVLFLKQGLHHYGPKPTISPLKQFWIHFYDGYRTDADEDGSVYDAKSNINRVEDYDVTIRLPKQTNLMNRGYFESKIKELFGLYASRVSYRQLSISLTMNELFLAIHRECREVRDGGKAHGTARRIADYLEYNLTLPLDTAKLADYMNLNYNYMASLFRKQTGYSIREYLERARVFKATELMRDTTMNVSEIGERVGYEDPMYFSRVFKKITGKSPSAYISQMYRNS